MSPTTPLDVIIIGAGSTGLLLAQGLKQNGIKCTVFEREDANLYQTRPREWGMTLHWGGEHIGKCVPPDMMKHFDQEVCCDPHFKGTVTGLPLYNMETGEKMLDMAGADPRRVSRGKLRRFLSKGLVVQYGKKITAIDHEGDEAVVATFSDGTTATGTLVVGADGSRSAVRGLLVGEDAARNTNMDINMFNVAFKFPAEVATYLREVHPIFKGAYHPDNYFMWNSIQDVQDPSKPETWLFQNMMTWSGPPFAEDFPDQAARIKFWKERAEKVAEPWKTIGKNLPDDLVFPTDRVSLWRPDIEWSAKFGAHATLAGDAAHNIPPFRGQGLNNALMDSAGLVDQLVAVHKGEKSLKEGIDEYEKEMRHRTLFEMQISVKQALMAHDFNQLLDAPFVKMGMHQYREQQKDQGKEVERVAAPA